MQGPSIRNRPWFKDCYNYDQAADHAKELVDLSAHKGVMERENIPNDFIASVATKYKRTIMRLRVLIVWVLRIKMKMTSYSFHLCLE
jgi:hypothetical protein